MGKHGGFMTAAAISKRMKAKGLGRLRWYCQMCEKQCRDENGFKNHTQSASHQRQLAIFSEKPTEHISRFSSTFRKEFLLVLRRRYGTSMVHANTVYQEYIKDRDHIHMNATRWTTLSGFVMEMGREGYCRVENREDGWWIQLVDRDAIEKDRIAREMDKHRIAEQQRTSALLQQQLQMAKRQQVAIPDEPEVASPQAGPISMSIKASDRFKSTANSFNDNPFESLAASSAKTDAETGGTSARPKMRRRSRWDDAKPTSFALDDIMKTDKKRDALEGKVETDEGERLGSPNEKNANNESPWILDNIAVKVTNREVGGGAFAGKKGRVVQIIGEYGAQVQMFDSSATLELDQDDLETVIPKPGGRVRLLRKPHRGLLATVKAINVDSYSVDVQLSQSGENLRNVEYEAVSRYAEAPS